MRKVIASINMTLDGFCDHTAVIADEELHRQANELLRSADTMLFGRVTYQLMESSWPPIEKKPTGITAVDDFAVLIGNMPKIVFSHTLKTVDWNNSTLAKGELKEEVIKLRQQPGKNIVVGSPSILITLMEFGLIDEYRFCIQPIVLGKGLRLFRHISGRIDLRLVKTSTLGSGAVTHYYKPAKK